MGKLKGQTEYEKFQEGKPLTRKEAILAQCYVCSGEEEGAEDCKGITCPLYAYFPYKGKKIRLSQDNQGFALESGSFMASQGKEMAGVGGSFRPGK